MVRSREFIANFVDMSKILVIGVGGAGRETVKHMKDVGIPEADYITFGGFEDSDERKDIPHYNLITMNGDLTDFHQVVTQIALNVLLKM